MAESVVLLLPVRVALGALFVFAAYLKLSDPQEFVFSINAFDVFDPERQEHVVNLLAFAVPWAEMVTGLALILGVWARGAAALLAVQLLAFTVAILKVISEGKEIACGCFGDYEWPCSSPIGWCHVARNAVLFASAALLVWRGAGAISVDGALTRPRKALDDDEDDG